MQSTRTEKGREGETEAAAYLFKAGYTLITKRFKSKHGEIDIVCLDDETLVFVEVKKRTAHGYVPEESVGEAKLNALQRAAADYCTKFSEKREIRFDLIAIDGEGLRHHVDILGHGL